MQPALALKVQLQQIYATCLSGHIPEVQPGITEGKAREPCKQLKEQLRIRGLPTHIKTR